MCSLLTIASLCISVFAHLILVLYIFLEREVRVRDDDK
jgi:hypothetical protein